jgi:two-component system chemotaxis response regulator CheB
MEHAPRLVFRVTGGHHLVGRRPGPMRRSNRAAATRNSRVAVARLLGEHGAALSDAAMTAGLVRTRPCSGGTRVLREAGAFTVLLAQSLEDPRLSTLEPLVRREVRVGAFARASSADLAGTFDVWREAMLRFLAGTPAGLSTATREGLDLIQTVAARELATWAHERIELVVVGASAGGIAALTTVLSALGTDIPASIALVMHLNPAMPSVLSDILTRTSGMHVSTATEGAALLAGGVYVAPPGRHLSIRGGHLELGDGPELLPLRPAADVLFASAALALGRRVASVVLTGSGCDGAAGTRAVHAVGGVTFAQDPRASEFSPMPSAAVATGCVDHVHRLERLGTAIRALVERGRGPVADPAR